MKAVVMAGGEGTRLRPLTARRPKPLAPVLNRPIMEHILLLLKDHGVTDVVVTLHYLADSIQGCFGDGSDLGVNLIYSVEETPLGTAGSVMQAAEHLRDDTFIIVSGDALTDLDIGRTLEFHRAKGAEATIVLSHVPNPLDFGVVITDPDARVRRFVEKPSWGEVFSDTVNTGMYVLEPSVFDYMTPGKPCDWSQDVFPRMLQQDKPLFGYVMPDYWCDIGNLAQYREAQYTALDGRVKVHLVGERSPGVWVGEGASIAPGAHLVAPVIVGKHTVVKPGAEVGPYSVIGDNTIIEEGAKIHRSVVWDTSYIGAHSRLTACTVCSHVVMQRDCDVQEGAVIGEGCRIERETVIRAQIKLWPDKVIESGSTVTMSLIWGQKWHGALFRDLGVAGVANIDVTPEFATKLGAAFGAFLKPGATVITGRDSGPAARMIKRAIISGLMSVGCRVLDMRSTAIPVLRHALRNSSASGGIYVRLSPDNPRVLLIELMDANGVYLNKAAERKVETIFYREDFTRVDAEKIGTLDFAGRTLEQYNDSFARQIQSDVIVGRKMKVVADFTFSRVAAAIGGALGRLGCEVVALNAFLDPTRTPNKAAERPGRLADIARVVTSVGADLGVMFENDGERLAIVDDAGQVVEDHGLLLLFAVLFARTNASARIAVPVTAPGRLEDLVALHGASVSRTKTDVRSLMAATTSNEDRPAAADLAGDTSGGFSFSSFHSGLDSMFACGKLLEMLTLADVRVSDIGAQIPRFHLLRQTVPCAWDVKGKVMREMAKQADSVGTVDLTDGVKSVTSPTSWTLVLPDNSEPCCHVFAEDDTDQACRRRLDQAVNRLLEIRDQGI